MFESIWQQCQQRLQLELPPQQYTTWIKPLSVNGVGNVLSLCAPNRFIQEWVENKYRERIQELVVALGYTDTSVEVASNLEAGRSNLDTTIEPEPSLQPADPELFQNRDTLNSAPHQDERRIISNHPVDIVAKPHIEAPAIITSAAERSMRSNLMENYTSVTRPTPSAMVFKAVNCACISVGKPG